MDSPPAYRDVIRRIVQHHAQYQPSHGDIRVDAVCDDQSGVYTLVYAGWDKGKRVHGVLLLVRLEANRIVVEYDGIYHGIYDDLIAAGVPADDIVLAYRRDQVQVAAVG